MLEEVLNIRQDFNKRDEKCLQHDAAQGMWWATQADILEEIQKNCQYFVKTLHEYKYI